MTRQSNIYFDTLDNRVILKVLELNGNTRKSFARENNIPDEAEHIAEAVLDD